MFGLDSGMVFMVESTSGVGGFIGLSVKRGRVTRGVLEMPSCMGASMRAISKLQRDTVGTSTVVCEKDTFVFNFVRVLLVIRFVCLIQDWSCLSGY